MPARSVSTFGDASLCTKTPQDLRAGTEFKQRELYRFFAARYEDFAGLPVPSRPLWRVGRLPDFRATPEVA